MKLAAWRGEQVWTQRRLADEIGCSQSDVSMMERNNGRIPSHEIMLRIYAVTRGAVTPNDFYDLPPIGQPQLALIAPGDAPLLEGAQ